jgi:MULE transposase domain
MELFVFLACVDGEGFPISYFTLSKISADGEKITALTQWFQQLKNHGIDPEFIFLDKDSAEISSARDVWPAAKLQLCWWHIIRAVDKRLKINKAPNFAMFDFLTFQQDCIEYNVTCPFLEKPTSAAIGFFCRTYLD